MSKNFFPTHACQWLCTEPQLGGTPVSVAHLGKLLLQRLQHIVHGALVVLPWRYAHHRLAVHGHVPRLHPQLGCADGVAHRLRVDLERQRTRHETGSKAVVRIQPRSHLLRRGNFIFLPFSDSKQEANVERTTPQTLTEQTLIVITILLLRYCSS